MGKPVVRAIIAVIIIIVVFICMGSADLIRNASASFMDIGTMTLSDFKEGDIICGSISESLGCAATIETTETMFGFIQTSKRTSAYYYVVPFYKSEEDIVPEKVIMYRTGNKAQIDQFGKLFDETMSYYKGDAPGTYTRVTFERGEVEHMSKEESDAFREFVDAYVDTVYKSFPDHDSIKSRFEMAMVGYVIKYTVDVGHTFLVIGLVGLVIFTIIGVLVILKGGSGRKPVNVTGYTYIGGNQPTPDPLAPGQQLMSPPPPPPMRNSGQAPMSPPPPPPMRNSGQPGGMAPNVAQPPNTNYIYNMTGMANGNTAPQRPVPPPPAGTGNIPMLDGMRQQPARPPVNPAAAERTTLIDSVFAGTGRDAYAPKEENSFGRPQASTFGRRAEPVNVTGDTMGSVDPHSSENVDLSNGGVELEDRTWGHQNAAMPKNGDLPVINPDRYMSLDSQQPEFTSANDNIMVQPIAPSTSRENASLDFQVQQTDPSMRNMYASGGSMMQEVDPYTETNVDLSNGGRELPEPEPAPEAAMPAIPDIPVQTPTVSDVPRVSAEMPTIPDVPRMSADIPAAQEQFPSSNHWDEIKGSANPWDSVNAAVREEINEAKSDPWSSIGKK